MTMEKGAFRFDLRRFHSTYPVPFPPCSAQEQHHLQTLQVGLELQESLKGSVNWTLGGDDQEDDIVKPTGARTFHSLPTTSKRSECQKSTNANISSGCEGDKDGPLSQQFRFQKYCSHMFSLGIFQKS